MKETLANQLRWSDLCDAFEKCKEKRGKDDKLKVLFTDGLRRIVHEEQSIYPILRLVLPQLDTERKRYNIKMSTWTKLYIRKLGINKMGNVAQRLRNWTNPDKMKQYGLLSTFASVAGDFPAVVEAVLMQQQGMTTSSSRGGSARSTTTITVGDINMKLDTLARSNSDRDAQASVVMWMLQNLSPMEQKWFIRVVLKDMKIGLKFERVLNFLGRNALAHYNACADLRRVVESLHDPSVGQTRVQIGVPFSPMLAKRYKNFTVGKSMGGGTNEFCIEPKMDGERMLVHKNGDDVKFFTRNMNDYTTKYGPSLAEWIRRCVTLKRCILDGEVMSWDNEMRGFVKFGHNRTVAKEGEADVRSSRWLCFLAFDILHNGDCAITHLPLRERQKLLDASILVTRRRVEVLPRKVVGKGQRDQRHRETMSIFDDTLGGSYTNEGIILKRLDAEYEIGEKSRRGGMWVKLKPEYIDCISETMDLVVLGGYYSKGCRRGGLLTALLMGLPANKNNGKSEKKSGRGETGGRTCERFYTVCKAGSGFKDSLGADLMARLKDHLHPFDPKRPPKHLRDWKTKPDCVPHVWVEPEHSVVLEIRGSEIIGTTDFTSRWTLRFPRIVRMREDKRWWQATSLEQFLSFVDSESGSLISNGKRSLRDLTVEEVRGRSPTKRRRKRVGSSSASSSGRSTGSALHSLTDTSNVKVAFDVFRGAEIMVFPPHHLDKLDDPERHSISNLHRMIKACNGRITMNVSATTSRVIAYSKRHFKVKNYIRGANRDVLSYRWLTRCVQARKIATPYPNEFIHQTADTNVRMRQLVDAYGDAFADPTDREHLALVLKSMVVKKRDIPTPSRIADVEGELRAVFDCAWRIFSGCVVHVVHASGDEFDWHASNKLKCVLLRMRLLGAIVSECLNSSVTHVLVYETRNATDELVICPTKNDLEKLRRRLRELMVESDESFGAPMRKRVVRVAWVEECVRRKQYIDPEASEMYEMRLTPLRR
eukprot:g867.t1